MTVKTSGVSPIRIGSSSSDMRTLYTAIEVTEIERTIETTATTTSLSVFSQ